MNTNLRKKAKNEFEKDFFLKQWKIRETIGILNK